MATLREDLVKITYDVNSDPLAEVDTAVDDIVRGAGKAVREMENAVSKVTEGTASAAEEAVNAAGKAGSKMEALAGKIRNIPVAVMDKLKNGVSKMKDNLKKLPLTILTKLRDGLKAAGTAALGAAKNVAVLAGQTALKGIAAAAAAATAGLVMVTKTALAEGAALEQNIGGVETLFGTGGKSIREYAASSGKAIREVSAEYNALKTAERIVLKNASEGWKTVGMSQNEYMETVTGFSAALVSSLGGDTVKAAKAADVALTDMADNANKMGTPLESIKTAYAGFAKQNYTMLDNLKLGYGGTKTEMERLLKDAQKISGQKYDLNNLADVYDAIHVIQGELGITGTTAREASSTITGSISAMKGAWSNLLADMAVGKDIEKDVDNLAESIMTAAENILPAAGRVLKKVPGMVTGMVTRLGPQLVPLAGGIVTDVVVGVATVLPTLLPVVASTMWEVVGSVRSLLPTFLQTGEGIVLQMASGIISNAPTLIPQGVSAILNFAQGAIGAFPNVLSLGTQVLNSVIQGIVNSLPVLAAQGPVMIHDLIASVIGALPELGQALLEGLIGILQNLPSLLGGALKGLGGGIMDGVKGWFSKDKGTEEAAASAIDSLASGIETSTAQVETAMAASSTAAATSFSTTMTTVGAPMMVTAAEEATTQLQQPFDNLDLSSSGEMAGQGFAQGLHNSRGMIMAEAQGIANDVQRTINSSLKINSPSQVAIDQMKYYGTGMALGLKKSANVVRGAASMLSGVVRGYADPSRGSGSATVANNTNRTTNNSYAPQFVLNMNGVSATPANQRKVRKWVRDAVNETFNDLGRQSGYAMG